MFRFSSLSSLMASTQIEIINTAYQAMKPPKMPPTTTKLVCFSFAAYAKNLIQNLRSSDVPVAGGLSNVEFSSIESLFNFSFPPDLRSILREGLPIGSGFPNWRSSSAQQLYILINLPILGLLKQISRRNFWLESWGPFPDDINRALEIAKKFLSKAPVLVPLYRNCYIPSTPNAAGNPVFYVDGEEVRILSYDITGFFQDFEFLNGGGGIRRSSANSRVNAPAWAAKSAREIELWTEVANKRRRVNAAASGAWWSGDDELSECLEEVSQKLREGGWREEEVREMMMMDGYDDDDQTGEVVIECGEGEGVGGGDLEEAMAWHVRTLSVVLLRAGWTMEDVVYSLDLPNDEEEAAVLDEKPTALQPDHGQDFQLHCRSKPSESTLQQLMHLQSLEV
ncbi:uncharacterized protein LOC133807121 [Humulus lupulus]|uniref:uncharacterized protein LOC133807121 n=1 Tax=Humulus lupulus TaxID=3486 RepID=UPI002B411B55|nr:uncharacterized protein LOC133807121 [Humulus lupulus]